MREGGERRRRRGREEEERGGGGTLSQCVGPRRRREGREGADRYIGRCARKERGSCTCEEEGVWRRRRPRPALTCSLYRKSNLSCKGCTCTNVTSTDVT